MSDSPNFFVLQFGLPARRQASSGLIISLLLCLCLSGCEDQRQPGDEQLTVDQPASEADYVGSTVCAECHSAQTEQWRGSHHEQAMQPAQADTIAGDFSNATFEHNGTTTKFTSEGGNFQVRTDDANGELADFEVRYTFGVTPLQQYLLEGDAGRLQALTVAWDNRPADESGQRWFHLHGDDKVDHNDVLHWTRPSANWNYMCADCHSTAIEKNYDPVLQTYDTQFAEISVGCEACHGPGSVHVSLAKASSAEEASSVPDNFGLVNLTDSANQISTCAPCHSRRGQIAEGFLPGANWLDHYRPALLDEGLYHADGQILDEVYVWGSFSQSKMYARGVTCSDCHDPHTAELKLSGDNVCTQCHNPVGRLDFPTLPKGEFDSPDHHFHASADTEVSCVSCHMAAKDYMVIDPRRDHSFRIPRPDLTVSLGVPNACTNCHADRTAAWASEAIDGWYGPSRADHYGATLAAGRQARAEAEEALSSLAADVAVAPIVRATALSLLVNYNLRISSQALQQGLRDASPLIRIGALRGARRWPADQRWQRTSALLNDDVQTVRAEAVAGFLDIFSSLDPDVQQSLSTHMQWYLQILDLNADVAEGQSNIASVYMALGDIPRAEKALQTSLSLNPQWVPGLINLADLYRGTGRDSQAGDLLDRALDLTPGVGDVLLAKALWLVRQGQAEEGLPLLARAQQSAPDNPRFAYVYMVALHSLGRSVAALDVADQFLADQPNLQLSQAAFGIARDANFLERAARYEKLLR